MGLCRNVGLFVAVVASAALQQASAAAQAPHPLTGTWKLNLAKSNYDPPDVAQRSIRATFHVNGDTITVSLEGVDSRGRIVRGEYTATFDGRNHPYRGTIDGEPNSNQDTVSWTRIDDRTYEVVNKLKEQVLSTQRIVVAADGRSRTTRITGRDGQGRSMNHVLFFERQ